MPQSSTREKQEVQDILRTLQSKGGTEPLRELIARLNYDPLNEPVSRKEWRESVPQLLAADPRIYGQAANGFYIIYAQLASDTLRLTDERQVVGELLKTYDYALFVFSDRNQREFHFVNVKWETTEKRRLYRRITIGAHERLRTATERIEMLDVEKIPAQLFELTPQDVQDQHDKAFDVTQVTKDFYAEYKRVFENMRDALKGFGTSPEEQDRRHLFVQRLFNRLMFLRFIQKKGWLSIDGDTDYLAALWRSHKKEKQAGKNFYTDRLLILFEALDNERVGELLRNGKGIMGATIGRVKYLNGGLFEQTTEDKNSKIRIPDAPFEQIFDPERGLFERFNFTITESTPLDVEVAVDPEMLGKIFEELVTGRHDTGSYYTPKPIVSFMCREALKGYLESQVPGESKEALARFVDKHEPDDIRDAEKVLNALRRVTVCDPACGSGAYLLGMMHELLDLRQCLFQTRKVDNQTAYERKLEIIQTNIYGVDIAEFAVNIARLRLWLSLAVDYDGPDPQPLPNLDFKIKDGDSVCSPSPGTLQMGLHQPLVNEFLKLKKDYFVAHHGDKKILRNKVDDIKAQIVNFSHRGSLGFDWVVDFAEVFAEGGFDVVLANPPYVSALEFSRKYPEAYRKRLTKLFTSTRGSYDLYIAFFERGFELLKAGGRLTYITPNKFLSASYGVAFREYVLRNAELVGIVDLSSVEVFTTAAVYPVITSLIRKRAEQDYGFCTRKPVRRGDEDPSQYEVVNFTSPVLQMLPENIWGFLLSEHVELLQKLLIGTEPLSAFGKVSATSTAAESDEFGEYISETKVRGSKKIVNTGTINPYRSLWGIQRMRHSGESYLTPYLDIRGAGVSPRRRTMYDSPKIVFAKMAATCEPLYDAAGEYASVNTNCFYDPLRNPEDLPAIAAYCGSKVFSFFYHQFFGALRMAGGYFQFQAPQLKVIPYRQLTPNQRKRLASVGEELSNSGDNPDKVEILLRNADEIVAEAFGLAEQERAVMESF